MSAVFYRIPKGFVIYFIWISVLFFGGFVSLLFRTADGAYTLRPIVILAGFVAAFADAVRPFVGSYLFQRTTFCTGKDVHAAIHTAARFCRTGGREVVTEIRFSLAGTANRTSLSCAAGHFSPGMLQHRDHFVL